MSEDEALAAFEKRNQDLLEYFGLKEVKIPLLFVALPLKTVNTLNSREHWRKLADRTKAHRFAAKVGLESVWTRTPKVLDFCFFNGGIRVELTHVGRKRDSDGVVASLKAVRDGVADALGIDDGDERVQWEYNQRKGKQGVEISIHERAAR